MPTDKARYQITETDAVAHAIDLAAQRWPGTSRARLAALLIEAGADAISTESGRARSRKLAAIRSSSGAHDTDYPPNYLAALRADWAE